MRLANLFWGDDTRTNRGLGSCTGRPIKRALQCLTPSAPRTHPRRRPVLKKTPSEGLISDPEVVGYALDLDPMHRVLRITVTTALTDESCTEIYQTVARVASKGGPYATIADLSQVVDFPVSCDTVRALAATAPAVPGGRARVIVASQPALYGLARMFQLSRDSMAGQLQVVQSMDEAYKLLEVAPRDFCQRLFPEDLTT